MTGASDKRDVLIVAPLDKVAGNCAADCIEFILTDDILPLFHAWLISKDGVSTGYTVKSLGEDMATILAGIRGENHPRVERHRRGR